MRITVALCTWNRSQRLRMTLKALTTIDRPDCEWELVLVDNASTDDTPIVAAEFGSRLPLRLVHETQPGLSNARNRAVREATGDYVVFTDDDVLPERQWLASYAAAFGRWHDAVVFGGPIEPYFEGNPPSWLAPSLEHIGPVFGRQSFGSSPVALRPEMTGEGPYGANMAFRRSVLSGRAFDPALGVRQGTYGIGEETQLIRSILTQGGTGWWIPEASLRHVIPASCQNIAYVRRWIVGAGRTFSRPQWDKGDVTRESSSRLVLRMIKHELLYRWNRWSGKSPDVWVRNLAMASHVNGQLIGRLEQSRHGGGDAPP